MADEIIEGLKMHVGIWNQRKTAVQYIPTPHKFLNNKLYLDEKKKEQPKIDKWKGL